MILGVQVKPNARQTRIVGFAPSGPGAGRTVILAIAAPPIDGKANDELISLVATRFHCRRSAISIKSGASGRTLLTASSAQ